MNICALDIIARTDDFESVASSLELRGWEWDLLHAMDGSMTIEALAHNSGVAIDDTIGFVHDAIDRGLVFVPTMTLQAYRARRPTQLAISGATTLSLPTALSSEPPTALSFASEAVDWEALDRDDAPSGVHYDARFGVEHPDGPFAPAPASEPLASAGDDAQETSDPAPADETLITTRSGLAHVEDAPEVAAAHVPIRFDDLFAATPPPEASAASGYTNGHTNGHVSYEEFEPVAEAASEPLEDLSPSPSRISFSFSPDDVIERPEPPPSDVSVADVTAEPLTQYEEPLERSLAVPQPIRASEPTHVAEPTQTSQSTQSTYHEREAIENDGTRDYEAKAKSWRESLSWREQQEIHEASEAGNEKSGVIGSLLRALGVR